MPRLTKTGRGEDTLGGRLTRSRLSKRWTQHQLASAVGTSQAVVQRIETGKCRHPRIVTSLASALEVSPAWLMYGVQVIEDIDEEAIDTARAWSRLPEPQRHVLKQMIMRSAAAKDATQPQTTGTSRPPSCVSPETGVSEPGGHGAD